MEAKDQLQAINRLLGDVYGPEKRISALLAAYLSPEQLETIKKEKLPDFMQLFLFGIRCHFTTVPDGMYLYTVLCAHYGLVDAAIGEAGAIPSGHLPQPARKALKKLCPTARYDPLETIACLAAREALGLPALPLQERELLPPAPPVPPLNAEALETILITGDAITLKALHQNINMAMGAARGEPGHIRLNTLRNWLLETGFLEIVADPEGKQSARPTALGREIGIGTATRTGPQGTYTATVFATAAQEFVRDNLPAIIAWQAAPKRRPAAPNQGAPWPRELDIQLQVFFEEGMPLVDIAKEMGRSKGSIRARLKKLGLIENEDDLACPPRH